MHCNQNHVRWSLVNCPLRFKGNFILFYTFHRYYGYLKPKLRGNEQGPDSISSFAGENQEKFVKQDGEKKLKKKVEKEEKN